MQSTNSPSTAVADLTPANVIVAPSTEVDDLTVG